MTVPIPDERARRKRIALIAGGLVLSVLLLGIGIAFALMALRPASRTPTKTYTPAEETTPSSSGTSSGSVEPSSTPSQSPSSSPAAPSTPTASVPLIAFRMSDSIVVSPESGAPQTKVITAPDGPFALSPDARALAVVRGGRLTIAQVQTKAASTVGEAEPVTPVWTPDSSAVLYVRDVGGARQIWRVPSNGVGAVRVGDGSGVAVSRDGRIVALLAASGDFFNLVKDGGKPKKVALKGEATSIVFGTSRIYVGTLSESGSSGIWSYSFDGGDARLLVGPAEDSGKSLTYDQLLVSPDGSKLLYAAVGDDGYSRMWVTRTASGGRTPLSKRRDDYPLAWSHDGLQIFFIEGNAIQGESTSLCSIAADGTRRVELVAGASQ